MNWDKEVDVLVVGSGNGALTAALSCYEMGVENVLVVEKGEFYGGTSAMSGGGIWVPNNHYAKAAGAKDSYEDAYRYLQETVPEGVVSEVKLKSYLKAAPEMLRFLHDRTQVRYESLAGYPDYYTDRPGSRAGHRSLEPATLSISRLGKDWPYLNLAHPMMYAFKRLQLSQKDTWIITGKRRGWKLRLLWLVIKDQLDLVWRRKSKQARRITNGRAGIARLRLSMQDRDMPLWLNTEFKELITDDEGRVIGAEIEREGKTQRVKAGRGLILAAGGFEQNQAMRDQYLPKPTNTQWSAGHKNSTGDAIRAGQKVGAALDQMDGAWWCTTLSVPNMSYPSLSIIDKSMPGSIVVNLEGKRIANESQNYMAYQQACFAAHEAGQSCHPSYMIFDARFRREYLVGPLRNSKILPDVALPAELTSSGFLTIASSLEELAEKVGVSTEGLAHTVARFNVYAENGKDEDFGRGDSVYDRYYGDERIKPNPCLAPIIKPPFYAVRHNPGDFGTNGGMLTDEHARVLDSEGTAIAGLYATGNCSSATLPTYPGPGSTLGPAMTFGYLAAKHIVGLTL